MSGFPRSPKLQKGALLSLDTTSAAVKLILAFQYNPDSLTRTIQAAEGQRTGDHGDVLRLTGPPSETIALDAELDATDQMESAEPGSPMVGVYPALSSLETMLYPSALDALFSEQLADLGTLEILPVAKPLTLLVWGPRRVLPVRLSGFTITEEAFDSSLNPIRAKVKLSMRVLTYQDLGMSSRGGTLFLGHHVLKESLALLYQGSAAGVITKVLGNAVPGGK